MYETIVPVTYKAMRARKYAKLTDYVAVIGDIFYSICPIKSISKKTAIQRCAYNTIKIQNLESISHFSKIKLFLFVNGIKK